MLLLAAAAAPASAERATISPETAAVVSTKKDREWTITKTVPAATSGSSNAACRAEAGLAVWAEPACLRPLPALWLGGPVRAPGTAAVRPVRLAIRANRRLVETRFVARYGARRPIFVI